MIEFSIHLPSVFIGFILGYVVLAAVIMGLHYDNRWSEGFGEGYKSGKDYAFKRMEEDTVDQG